MRPFRYRAGELRADGVALERLARRFGTPLYVYDFDAVAAAFGAYRRAFADLPHRICAAVKANANLALLHHLAALGSGFDVVSGGELEAVLHAGGAANSIVFSGVGKTAPEIDLALRAGILLFQVESEPELEVLAERAARLRRLARFGLRVNPNIAASTHPHIATGLRQHKFGVTPATARRLYHHSRTGVLARWLRPEGIGFHIGSQIMDTAPLAAAARRIAKLALELERAGLSLRFFDVGGGLGIAYQPGDNPPTLADYAAALRPALAPLLARPGRCLLLEPGRSLFGPAGALLTTVLYVKDTGRKRFVITDAGANDLLRPTLYGAHHEILPVRRHRGQRRRVDVVGPLCESGDTFARARPLPPVRAGDCLALLDVGAYGFVLASNYNARPRPAEVALDHGRARLVRARETIADLLSAGR